MHLGKEIRLSRIINPVSKKTIIVPMDHHGTGIVPIKGIEDPAILSEKLVNGGADAILAHTGTLKHGFAKTCIGKGAGSILHMCVTSGLSPKPNRKMIVNTLKTAITMGVDAVSTQLNLGDENENEMIQDLALLANECNEWGIPLIAMVYVRGHDLKEVDLDNLKLSARIASELGCDMVKIPYIGNSKEMEEIVNSTQIPVVIAGGSKMSDIETLEMISGAMEAGCSGLSVGRNVFARKNPEEFLNIVKKIVHEGLNLEEAKKML